MNTAQPYVIILLLAFSITACQNKNEIQLCDDQVAVLDINLMEQKLVEELAKEDPMGYAYVITRNGQVELSDSKGLAQSPQDGNVPFTTNSIMHIASVSKTITTAAVLRLLSQKGLTVHDKIYPYLPSDWTLDTTTKSITFYFLLSHYVKFPVMGKASVKFDSLKAYAERGVGLYANPQYSNINHAMFRVIIPRLWDKYRPAPGSDYGENFTAQVYESYIQEEIFQPLGIVGYLNTQNLAVALAYQNSNITQGKLGPADYTLTAGAYGWQMSAIETAKFWAYLWFSNDILDNQKKEVMKSEFLGLWNSTTGKHGTYYGKRGEWFWRAGDTAPKYSYNSFVIMFADNIQVTLLINSALSVSLRDILIKSYEGAYVNECL